MPKGKLGFERLVVGTDLVPNSIISLYLVVVLLQVFWLFFCNLSGSNFHIFSRSQINKNPKSNLIVFFQHFNVVQNFLKTKFVLFQLPPGIIRAPLQYFSSLLFTKNFFRYCKIQHNPLTRSFREAHEKNKM